jgi:stearoyl-CoA desaturase (Delta-9 desaturase)
MIEIIYTLVTCHITILCAVLYLHRGQAHRLIKFHPILEHLIRCWLWLTTGVIVKQWVAMHRLHHQYTDVPGDPHSPMIFGLKTIMLKAPLLNVFHNKKFTKELAKVGTYGAGTPDDWIEQNLYTPYSKLGLILLFIINLTIFGIWGVLIWCIQLFSFPFIAGGMINGLAHYWGYRNYDTNDNSHNLCRIGILVGGDELHNNHHKYPARVKLSHKPGEFDVSWMWLSLLIKLKLASLTIGN